MAYFDTPISTDNQDVSAPQIRTNFSQANTSFGTDHYAFDDATANNGNHKVIRTPDQSSAPTTSSSIAAMYGLIPAQVGSGDPVGLIQFSRGPSDATPSPVTNFHGTIASLTTTPTTILDLTGLSRAIVEVYALSDSSTARLQQTLFYNGTTLVGGTVQRNGFVLTDTSPIIQISATTAAVTQANVYWTIKLLRLS